MVRRIAALTSAAAFVGAGVASAAQLASYSGSTGQGQTLSLSVRHNLIVSVKFIARYRGACSGSNFSSSFKRKIKIDKHGKFGATVHPNAGSVVKISGRFKGKVVTGSLTSSFVEGGIHGQHTCSSGKVAFRARLK